MLSHLILGFLRDGQARHGYELITEYKARSGNQVSAGNFYRELARMASERLVQTGVNPPDADARRIPYQITEKGRHSFDEWVMSPGRDDGDLSSWFLFIDRVPHDTRDRLLDRWQDDLWLRSKSLSRQREDALLVQESRQDTVRYHLLASLLSRRLKQVTADLEFLKEFRDDLPTWFPPQRRPFSASDGVREAGRSTKGTPRK
jgi:DNA-binding PadR family transcriptional regulator